MSKSEPKVAIGPIVIPPLQEAVEEAGGTVVDADVANAVVWIDPTDPEGLAKLLTDSPARWVQLPFAGIESFFAAGVIDPARTWTCTKGAYGPACGEHALALMLAAARCLPEHVRADSWRATYAQLGQPERRLKGMTVLIVGTGGIGKALAEMLKPLETRILGINRSGNPLKGAERTGRTDELISFLPEADYVVIAAALTEATRNLIGPEAFAAMKPGAWLINVARGGLVDTDALVEALQAGGLGGAGLDVTEPEPLPDGHPLWGFGNVIITPHVANTADMAIPELREVVRRNVEHFAKGERLEGLIDVSLGY